MKTASPIEQVRLVTGLAFLGVMMAPADVAHGWSTTFVERGQSVGMYASGGVFPPSHPTLPNRPAVSYYDSLNKLLRFAWFDGMQWHTVVVDEQEGVGSYCSLAFLPSGQPAISYYDTLNTRVKYAEYVGDDLQSDPFTWSLDEVDNDGNVGQYTSLAILPDGQPGMSYRVNAPAGDVKYAKRDISGTWTVGLVADTGSVTHSTSLRVQPFGVYAGQPAIAYFDSSQADLKFAYFDGVAWNLCPVDAVGSVGYWCSLAFLPSGQPAISYRDETNDSLKYAWHDGDDPCSGWSSVTVDNDANVGNFTSLAILPEGGSAALGFDATAISEMGVDALDLSGQPVISYRDGTNSDLKLAWFDGQTWSKTTVDPEDAGEYTSMVILPDTGQPAVFYYETTTYKNLKYAAFAGFGWFIERVDTAREVGQCTSLAFLPSGHPVISYYSGYPDYDCKFAWLETGGWKSCIIDARGNIGGYTSMEVFSLDNPEEPRRGQPAIAYYDYGGRDDWLSWHEGSGFQPDGADWRTTRATDRPFTGTYVSLGFFPTDHLTLPGRAAISYTRELSWLSFSWEDPVGGSVWPSVIVDTEGGTYTSLVFLPTGRPAVSYYVDSNRDLKYAQFVGSDLANPEHWCKVLVDEDAYTGAWTSIAVVGGLPAIAYASTDGSTLKYARCTSGDCCESTNWQTYVVDPASMAAYASIAVLPSGQPAISYFDNNPDHLDLKFCWHEGNDYATGWHCVTVDAAGDVGRWDSLAIGPGGRVAISYFDNDKDSLKYAESLLADSDFDGDVDLDDLEVFNDCASGPGLPRQLGCEPWDFDSDGDIDQSDFGVVQRCYSGENIPADPNCAN